MLLQRVVTGFVLGVLILAVVLFLPIESFVMLTLLLTLAMGWEWSNLAPFKERREKWLYLFILALCMAFFLSWLPAKVILLMLTIFWIGCVSFLVHYPNLPQYWQDSWVRAFLGLLTLSAFAVGLVVIRALSHSGAPWLLLMLVLIWGADVGAYFAGRLWGKNRLAPQVSPGKTWEGVIGGLVLSYIVAGCFAYFSEIGGLTAWQVIALVLGVNLFAVVGDLFISLLKRQVGCKDTGRLLPGHGGLLDRLDGFVAVTPVFALWLLLYSF